MTCCRECGQELPETRLGARLSPLKTHIFDVVKRAAATGVTSEELFAIVFADRGDITINTLKSHIWQINDALEDAGFRIVSRDRRWVLVAVEIATAAERGRTS
jgi:hypothetical protein